MCSDGSACCVYYHDVVNNSMETVFSSLHFIEVGKNRSILLPILTKNISK